MVKIETKFTKHTLTSLVLTNLMEQEYFYDKKNKDEKRPMHNGA